MKSPFPLAKLRLLSQRILEPIDGSPAELVRTKGALQAQDYESALWAVGLRVKGATQVSVEKEIADRKIVRTWPMRRTLHFVPAEDARWMVGLSEERVIASAATRAKQLELDDKVFAKTRKVVAKTLADGKPVTRDALRDALVKADLPAADSRASHLYWRMAQEGLICFGPREGKQPTFVLLESWVPQGHAPEREEGIRILAQRYFTSHGPATLKDFCWWAGLKVSEAKAAVAALKDQLEKISHDGTDYWMSPAHAHDGSSTAIQFLPAFDEIVISYQDRTCTLAAEHSGRIVPGGNGMFLPVLVEEGQVIATWKRTLKKKEVSLTLDAFGKLTKKRQTAIARAAEAYGRFLGLPAKCDFP